MSEAKMSKWDRLHDALASDENATYCTTDDGVKVATVTQDGLLVERYTSADLTPCEAIEFALWIIEWFGTREAK